jgi:hypothetical protein
MKFENRRPLTGAILAPKNGALRLENTYFWNVYLEILIRQLGPTPINPTAKEKII